MLTVSASWSCVPGVGILIRVEGFQGSCRGDWWLACMAITFLKIWLLLWVCVHHGFRLAYLYLTRNDLQALRMPINYLVRMTYAPFDSYEPSLKFADYLYLRHLFTCGVFPLTWNDFYSRCFFLSKLVGNSFA